MKSATFLVYLTNLTATIAMAVPSPAQVPLHSAEVVMSNLRPVADPETAIQGERAAPAVEQRETAEAQIPVYKDQDRRVDDEDENTCFCAGTSICCSKHEKLDCSYGLCGIWA